MLLLVRTWNLFHGNAKPPEREAFLENMVRLISADGPAVVCLQEVPVWALGELRHWSGMQAFGAVAARPTLGPLPSTPGIGRAITALDHGLLRSAFSGQANAMLVATDLRALEERVVTLNPRRFRTAQARRLSLSPFARVAWPKERRVCQAVRLRLDDGSTMLVGNLHATSYPPDERLADAELLRAATFLDGLAGPEEPVLLAGDLNVRYDRSRTLLDLCSAEWGFHGPSEGIDHVLVRGIESERPERWPIERRELDGRVLSDHTPVEVRVG